MFTLSRGLSVFDVLVSIFNEITFIGNPTDRNYELEKLKGRLKNVHKKGKTISLDEFLKKLRIDLPKKDE